MNTITILGHVVLKGSKASEFMRLADEQHRMAERMTIADCPSLAATHGHAVRHLTNRATCARGYIGRAP